jgi:hypothetical protein
LAFLKRGSQSEKIGYPPAILAKYIAFKDFINALAESASTDCGKRREDGLSWLKTQYAYYEFG